MKQSANYEIVEEDEDCVLIRDVGPWEQRLTITNDAEAVVRKLAWHLNGRRLEYIDSDGFRSRIKVTDGAFAGFAPALQ